MKPQNNQSNKRSPARSSRWIKWLGPFIGAIGMAVGIWFMLKASQQNLIDDVAFQQLAKDKKIEQIEIYPDYQLARIHLLPTEKEEAKEVRLNLLDALQFQNDLRSKEAQWGYEQAIPIKVVPPSLITSPRWLALFILGIVACSFFYFNQRRRKQEAAKAKEKNKPNFLKEARIPKVSFQDVAGLKEAKVELVEIVDFLKNPQKYTRLGGQIPKGVLLAGPPGTGKTLMAKAVAGEADVPFYSLSGADFVEVFVGVGSARVRDLFKVAKEKAPCIIFIDEIDAVGRARGMVNTPSNNSERENTLNSLLVEMDGFDTNSGVIIMAATNRPDILDSALVRSGRFNRVINVGMPDIKGREAIFQVHLAQIALDQDVELHQLASLTPGFSGADIANLCNEAALVAARRNHRAANMSDFQYALDRHIGGLETKSKIISQEDRQVIAYHEAGHAICSWYLSNASPLIKVSIVPRGQTALGYTQYLPGEKKINSYDQLFDQIAVALGGRVAEELIFDQVYTTASSDLEKLTKIAYNMVMSYGMSEDLKHLSYRNWQQYHNKPFSEKTAETIDQQVQEIIDQAYQKTLILLKGKKTQLMLIANALLEKEVLTYAEIKLLIGEEQALHKELEDLLNAL
ncbi:MAG: ATP-dependent zinc metalloprotease FtsH [Bacteroidota bacterium]